MTVSRNAINFVRDMGPYTTKEFIERHPEYGGRIGRLRYFWRTLKWLDKTY